MSDKPKWEHKSLEWLHEARRRHFEESANSIELSPEAQDICRRLNLPAAKNLPCVRKPKNS